MESMDLSAVELFQFWAVTHRWMFAAGLFVLGTVVGSFLNVVIHRLPRDQSIIKPRSRCPHCGETIRWYDNVPLVSFALLRARCRFCKQKISWRYPLVELLTGALLVAIFIRFGPTRALPIHFAFSAALVAVSFIDLDHRIIPNEISLPGILLGFGCSFLAREGFWVESLIGIGVGGGGLLLLSLAYALIRGREGMGMGDIKLLAMLGAWLGWRSLLFIVLFASLQGVAASVGLALAGVKLKPPLPEEWEIEQEQEEKKEEQEVGFLSAAIPFGPFLALSAVEYLFLGQIFFDWVSGVR